MLGRSISPTLIYLDDISNSVGLYIQFNINQRDQMNRKMIIAVLVVLAMVAVGTIAVLAMNPSGGEGEGPVSVIDADGRLVVTKEAPARLVSCSPSLTEIVYALGIGDRLVAVTDYCDWPADVGDRKTDGSLVSIGGYWTPSVEAIIAAGGDLVLLDKGVQAQMDMLSQLEGSAQKVIILDKGATFEEVYSTIELLGEVCWVKDEAEDLVASMQARLANIEEAIADVDEPPSLVFAVWLEPIYLSAGDTFVQDVMDYSKGENAYGNMTGGWPDVAVESLLEKDPDYLIVSMMYLPNPGEQIISDLENDTIWSELSAVQNGRVYIMTGQADNVFCRPGPRMVDAVEIMAKILHPDVFGEDMPHVISNDYVDLLSAGSGSHVESLESALNLGQVMMARIE